MKEKLLGYHIDALDADTCCDEIIATIESGRKTWLACFNPHSYVVSKNDAIFCHALRSANWLVPDGVGVLVASKLMGGRLSKRVTGSDIFHNVSLRMNSIGGMKVFFLGSTEDTLSMIQKRMSYDYPRIQVVGTYSPAFKPEYSKDELDHMLLAINATSPDVLWVGMTAPKQEKWIFDNLSRLNVKFAGAIGAVFDFYAGKVVRPHPWFQKLGLEWLPRLLQQPRRLWRRTLISAPIFLLDTLAERVRSK